MKTYYTVVSGQRADGTTFKRARMVRGSNLAIATKRAADAASGTGSRVTHLDVFVRESAIPIPASLPAAVRTSLAEIA